MSENEKQKSIPKRLYRSIVDKMIGGVCGGFAEYFKIDATIVRVVWIIFTFMGFGIIAYIACLIVMKENPSQDIKERKEPQNASLIIGIVLVLLGFAFFSSTLNLGCFYFRPYRWHLFRPWFIGWEKFWPIVIILIGVFYIYHILKKEKRQNSDFNVTGESTTVIDKKIRRSRKDKMIGGVCSGIAEYLNIDPVIMRVLWIMVTLFSTIIPGIIVYIVLLIIIPEEETIQPKNTERTGNISPIETK